MISVFGVTSIFIVMVSVTVIILHNRIMKRRTPVDIYVAELEDLIRKRMEMLYEISIPGTKLHELCTYYIDLDFDTILNGLPEITHAYTHADERYETAPTALDENTTTIQQTTNSLNHAVKDYNDFITKSPTEVMLAKILGLETHPTITTGL